MGNTCTPVADSCQYMAKPIQCFKVISLQKKKKKKYLFIVENRGKQNFIKITHSPII